MQKSETLAYIDFNLGRLEMVSRGNGVAPDLLPMIHDALSREYDDRSAKIPGHPDFSVVGAAERGVELSIFERGRLIAAVFAGDGEGARVWEAMDGLCHRVFGSPEGQLNMPQQPWAVLVRFPKLRDDPYYDWLTDFAKDVGWAWFGSGNWQRSWPVAPSNGIPIA